MKSWSEFWENDTTYACEKHKEIVENCTTNQQIELVNKNDTVLDFGCGESSKNRLSNAVKELYLYGDANQIIQRLQKRYKNKKNICSR
jgi:ribosome biogenesis protein Nip4